MRRYARAKPRSTDRALLVAGESPRGCSSQLRSASRCGREGTIERAGGPSACWAEADAPCEVLIFSS